METLLLYFKPHDNLPIYHATPELNTKYERSVAVSAAFFLNPLSI